MSVPLTNKRSQMTYRQWWGGDGGQDEISFLNEPLYQGVLVIKTPKPLSCKQEVTGQATHVQEQS